MTDYREMPSGTRWPVLTTSSAPFVPAQDSSGIAGPWHATPLSQVVPADSRELVPLDVTAAGQPITSGLQVSLTADHRDRDWRDRIETHDGRTALRLGDWPAGRYYVNVRHTSGAVMQAGMLTLA